MELDAVCSSVSLGMSPMRVPSSIFAVDTQDDKGTDGSGLLAENIRQGVSEAQAASGQVATLNVP